MRRCVLLGLVVLAGCGGGDEERAATTSGPTTPERPAVTIPAPRSVEPGARAVRHLEALLALTRRHGGDRAASGPGERAAADYATDVLRGAGYAVRRSSVRFPFFDERSPARVSAGGERIGTRGEVRTIAYSPGGDVRGRLRTVALDRADSGCRAADLMDVRSGEVVLARRGVCPFHAKVRLAAQAGAAAVVVADLDAPEAPRATLGSPAAGRVPAVVVGSAVGRRLERAAGERVRVVTDTVAGQRRSPIVVAAARGLGASAEAPMVGGHLDSVPDAPGANDNATGVAAALAAAEALAARDASVRVGLWGAEELGLHGSRRYVATLDRAERRAISAYVNLDMVGSPNGVPSVYAQGPERGARRLGSILRRALDARGEAPERSGLRGGSDHTPFARAGIPAGGIFTGASARKTADQARTHGGRAGRALDPCYHRSCDDAGNVDRAALRRAARAAATALRRLTRSP